MYNVKTIKGKKKHYFYYSLQIGTTLLFHSVQHKLMKEA